MTTQAGLQIRLVKCPRCRKILPESPEVSMYKCGWCGIILQAKNKISDTNPPELPLQETDSSAETQLNNVLRQTEDRSITDHLTNSTKVDSSPNSDKLRCEVECDESVELSHNRGASNGLSGSPDITSGCSENLPSEVRQSNDHEKWTAGSNSSNELCSSGEMSLEAEECILESSEHVRQYNPSQLHRDFSLEGKTNVESQPVWPEDDSIVDEVQNLPDYEDQESVLPERMEDNYVLPENDEMSPTSSMDQNGESSGESKPVGPDSPSVLNFKENNIIAPSVELVNDGSVNERNRALNLSYYIHAPRSQSKGSLDSFYFTCDDEQDLSRSEVARNFQRINSGDTLGSSNLGDFSSELKIRPCSTAYYPTSRNYYAYDGSESSYDGIDDQVCEHVSYPSKMDKDTQELRRDGSSGNIRVTDEAERLYWGTSASSHRAMHHPRIRGKSTETNRFTGRNRMKLSLHQDVPRSKFPSTDHIACRRPATMSGHQHKLPPPHSVFDLSDKSSYSDPDKMDLLRIVYQLTDQLQRMQFPKPMPNRRFPEEGSLSPSSCNLLASERDMYADVSHVAGRYSLLHDRSKGCGERYNDPRMAFSGEVSHFRQECCSRNWHYSGQLPSCSIHHKSGHCSSLNPHRYVSSEPSSWDFETKSDNQRLAEIKWLQLREKYQMAKRHVRPIAGGAPVIICYHCSELLQLPVDSLLFKKRYHKLMCNACQKVLKFSFTKGTTHLIPYIPHASAPPPSETGDYKEARGRKNQQPVPHSSSCHHVEALSCSDDYGQSFCRSCSTEGEASVVSPPLDQVKRDPYNRKMSSRSSHDPIEDRKLKGILKESERENYGSLESVESVRPSSRTRNRGNATTSVSEIEELPPLSNPPLHLLFGYSTASKVLKR